VKVTITLSNVAAALTSIQDDALKSSLVRLAYRNSIYFFVCSIISKWLVSEAVEGARGLGVAEFPM
jgi:hypothetical protein